MDRSKFILMDKSYNKKLDDTIKEVIQLVDNGEKVYGYFSDKIKYPSKRNHSQEGWLVSVCEDTEFDWWRFQCSGKLDSKPLFSYRYFYPKIKRQIFRKLLSKLFK